MTEQNLIINGVDHAKFDLEWAKRGGVLMMTTGNVLALMKVVEGNYFLIADFFKDDDIGWRKNSPPSHYLHGGEDLRMAIPAECEAAGIEYIDPPIRWLQIDSAPEDGRIIEVADFRVVVANECPLSKHWKFWRDIPHPLNKNSMTQPPKGE